MSAEIFYLLVGLKMQLMLLEIVMEVFVGFQFSFAVVIELSKFNKMPKKYLKKKFLKKKIKTSSGIELARTHVHARTE